ncbi:hypothetical protein [Oscillatoria acuminata]|uniref:Uncharacterized protein n=1 Tax=Oscillatoria acuminata PCC 6304 TaxID=56110 RepID=K9TSC0_9CYAN|nr:hypothetical protein [Oscillatoria acuminata]AFY85455.1 hypothetical protein Oscil6304_5993 [Oscillatoria acuminata PCC 6304]
MSFNEFSSEPKRHIPTDAIIVLGATLSVFLLGGILHLLSGGARAQEEPAPMTMTEESLVVESVTPRPETETQLETRVDETRIITQAPPVTQEQPGAVQTPPAGMNNEPFVGSAPPVVQQPPVVTEQPAVPPTTPDPTLGEAPPAVTPSPDPTLGEAPAPTLGEAPTLDEAPAPTLGEAPPATLGEAPGMMGESPDMMGEAPGMTGESPDMMGEAPAATAQPQAIADPAVIETLNQSLYEQIDSNWRTIPTFTQDLAYRVQINEQGEIVSYEPVNPVAQQYTAETPLPNLSEAPPAGSATAQPLANFRVVFTPDGQLQVNPWQNDIPQ